MARNPIPTYRKQKTKSGDLAFVEFCGVRHYLGPFGSQESREAYGRMVAEWTANGGRMATEPDSITVTEILAEFWKFAEGYYANPNGDSTSELSCYRQTFKPLQALYGSLAAKEFGPIALKAVRQKMIDNGWCRTYINRQVFRLKRAFKWASSEELVAASVFHRLETVESLKRGRTKAPESDRIVPVEDSVVEATLPYLTPTLRAMITTQRLTGMRPSEVCRCESPI